MRTSASFLLDSANRRSSPACATRPDTSWSMSATWRRNSAGPMRAVKTVPDTRNTKLSPKNSVKIADQVSPVNSAPPVASRTT
ncbi:hypothetical protein ACFPRL_25705 [Pseudoclavibacter helvolus]